MSTKSPCLVQDCKSEALKGEFCHAKGQLDASCHHLSMSLKLLTTYTAHCITLSSADSCIPVTAAYEHPQFPVPSCYILSLLCTNPCQIFKTSLNTYDLQ